MPNPLVVPYSELGFGGARPYLFLQVTGLDGRGRTIPGLIDSGADNSVLPAGYAPIMGYSGANLAFVQGSQVSGSVTLRCATKPAAAYSRVPQPGVRHVAVLRGRLPARLVGASRPNAALRRDDRGAASAVLAHPSHRVGLTRESSRGQAPLQRCDESPTRWPHTANISPSGSMAWRSAAGGRSH